MKVVVTGGAGFIGSRLTRALLDRGKLVLAGKETQIDKITIFDLAKPTNLPDDTRLEIIVGEMTDVPALKQALKDADTVFHLASVVSGGAEADLHLGLSVNLDSTRSVLDILAETSNTPKLIFSSSVAIFGGGAEVVTEQTAPYPRSSYGAQKVCCEHLVGDYTRRGLIDGRSMRFPTIAVRPGKPNLANSSFISSIIREPAAGQGTVCPVPEDTEISLMSPGRLIEAIINVHNLASDDLGWPRTLLLPAVKVTVGQMLDALEQETSPETRALVSFEMNEEITTMIKSWPVDIVAERAESLGIHADRDALEIVQEYLKENG